MRSPRPAQPLRLFMWFGVLGAPFAWTLQFLVGYGLTEAACNPGGDRGLALNGTTLVATVAAASIAVLAELSALKVFLHTRPVRGTGGAEEPPPRGRVHFLGTVGLLLGPLFFCIIVMSGVGAIVLTDCHQS
ncbi:MAG: hypothetical protein ABR581_11010 [Thermoleophilaceae bacterium]